MTYDVVELQQKQVVGVAVTTAHSDAQMGEKIANLWTQLYQTGVHQRIANKLNEHAIGLYTNYQGDTYTAMAGNEVSQSDNADLVTKVIPAGRYAKFSVHGNMVTAVAQAWEAIAKLDLKRAYTVDFEEYYNDDWENADIAIYIALA